MKRKLLAALLAVCLTISMTACGSAGGEAGGSTDSVQEEETVMEEETPDVVQEGETALETEGGKITMLCDDATTQENFDEYLKAAEEATGLEIEVIPMPTNTSDRTAKVMTILSSGDESVDVISLEQEMITTLVETDYLEPLDDILTDEVRAAYPESFIEMSQGKGIPMFMEIFCFWMNAKYMEESGMESVKTKEEFVEFLEKVSNENVFGYGGGWEQSYVWIDLGEFVNLFGGNIFDWSDENTQAGAKFLKEMVDKGYTSLSQLADQYTELNQRIMDGSVACMMNYSSFMPTYLNAERYGEDDIYIAPMLNFNKEITNANGWQYALNAASQNKEAAKKFLEWAASLEGQKVYGETFSRLPARTDVVDDPEFSLPGLEQLRSYLEETELVTRPLPANAQEYTYEVGALFQKYVSGEMEFEEYVEKMQDCMNKYFPEETAQYVNG